MAKAISKKGSRGRISSRKSIRKIPKGVIHIQATFNNTVVTVTDIRGRVVSWSFTSTCSFRGTRRGTPFCTQTAMANATWSSRSRSWKRRSITSYSQKWYTINFIRDVTPMPHNGYRPPKKGVCRNQNRRYFNSKRNKRNK